MINSVLPCLALFTAWPLLCLSAAMFQVLAVRGGGHGWSRGTRRGIDLIDQSAGCLPSDGPPLPSLVAFAAANL